MRGWLHEGKRGFDDFRPCALARRILAQMTAMRPSVAAIHAGDSFVSLATRPPAW